jgi:predicted MFS family arabinose efflux permease
MVIILSVWGFIHTGGFLAANIQLTHGIQEPALDFVNSLLPSFFNAGITLGTLLGGFVIAHYGIHEVIWMTVPLLLLAFGMSFITSNAGQKVTSAKIEEIVAPEPAQIAVSD